MQITKFGHSCLMVEENGARILVDPGNWSEDVSELQNLDALFISHEHQDHCDIEKVKILLLNNSGMTVYTNPCVGKVLTEAGIIWTEFVHGQKQNVKGSEVEAIGEKHAEIYSGLPTVDNTSLLIASRLFYPGDSFAVSPQPVEILALPVCAPWTKMSETLDYVKKINPKICFPVHDAMLKYPGPWHRLPKMIAEEMGAQFIVPEIGMPFTV